MRVAPIGRLHQPLPLELIIRNLHQARTACPSVVLELEATDPFIVAGLRSGRLPTLLPGAEERVHWQIIPLECGGAVPLPRIRVFDKRKVVERAESVAGAVGSESDEGDEVQVVDVRWDARWSDGTMVMQPGGPTASQRTTIVVTPS